MKEIIIAVMAIAGAAGCGYSAGRVHEMYIQKKEAERIVAQLKKNAQMWAEEHDDFMSGKTQTTH